ncbi:hypothetical protein [Planctomycetes bacterium K23_9]|uniref:Asparagine synthetase domain-containing protein n=1 Tax=Stieleria marina TaxID=1930275 RepID=A0A517NMJ9_9BACT|nr:hypothetical protein K239x_02990 [Planctomycetes bacterium K23_9]
MNHPSVITNTTLWLSGSNEAVSADQFVCDSDLLPAYQLGDRYSTNPLSLVRETGELHLRRDYIQKHHLSKKGYTLRDGIADVRLKMHTRPVVGTQVSEDMPVNDEVTRANLEDFARAVQLGVQSFEERFPDANHYIMVGGKDSLNLLLLDWQCPMTAVSAEPNYPLVKKFVEDNRLDVKVVRLEDPAPRPDPEMLHNFGRLDMEHARWLTHLQQFVDAHDRTVLWSGLVMDIVLKQDWRRIIKRPTNALNRPIQSLARNNAATHKLLPVGLGYRTRLAQAISNRCSLLQGSNGSLLQSLFNCHALSPYHLPEVLPAMSRWDILGIDRDWRPDLGQLWLGKPVIYPEANPGPVESTVRGPQNSGSEFLRVVEESGLKIVPQT